MSVIILANDNTKITADINAAKISGMLKNLLDVVMIDDDQTNLEIPVSEIDGHILAKIVDWLQHEYQNPRPQPKEGEEKAFLMTEYDIKFVDDLCSKKNSDGSIFLGDLFFVLLGANRLDISDLVQVCLKKIADLIKETDLEKLDELFKIK